MPEKEWIATHDAHQIRVTNTWLGGTKLYINGQCRDTSNAIFASPGSPTLSARVEPVNGETFLVEVYFKALVTVKAKICIDGKQIGGDVF